MSPTNPIRESLLEARDAAVEAIAKIDAALKKMEEVEGLRIVPRYGRMTDAILEYLRMQLQTSPAKTQVEASPKEVHEALLSAGWDVNAAAVHQAMHRMGKRGVLHAMGHGMYAMVAEEKGEEANEIESK